MSEDGLRHKRPMPPVEFLEWLRDMFGDQDGALGRDIKAAIARAQKGDEE